MGDGTAVQRRRHIDEFDQQLREPLLHYDHRLLTLLPSLVGSSHFAMVQVRKTMGWRQYDIHIYYNLGISKKSKTFYL